MTYLAVPIIESDPHKLDGVLRDAVERGAEMLELRLDYLNSQNLDEMEDVVRKARATGLPVIATCRPVWEGGRFKGSENERQTVLNIALMNGADFADIELAALQDGSLLVDHDKAIVSSHDFDAPPGNFHKLLDSLKLKFPHIVKVAYQPESITDCFPIIDMLYNNPDSIGMAMGEAGMITRLLAKKLGAFLTFASLDDNSQSAPGQISLEQMKQLYRWDRINRDSALYGVIGYPIGHSKSPLIHNAAFDAIDHNGLYIPLLIDPIWDVFKHFVNGLIERDWLDFRGLSITIPHKHNAMDYVTYKNGYLEPLAERIGVINTIVIGEAGKVSGYNTDYAGAMQAIMEGGGLQRSDFKDLKTAVIGAGGVARAIVAGLTDMGAKVTIYNRTVDKAVGLAEDFACDGKGLDALPDLDAGLLINCTRLGMHPDVEDTPVPAELLKANMIVFDTVYNPLETRLLREAAAAGAVTIDGVSMFINQAARQFELFTGKTAPRQVMRTAMGY